MDNLEKKINEIHTQVQLIAQKIDILNDHERRIRRLETFSSKIVGALVVVSSVVGAIVGLIITKIGLQ